MSWSCIQFKDESNSNSASSGSHKAYDQDLDCARSLSTRTGCRWTGALAVFLEKLARHLSSRVNREQSPGGETEHWSSDEDEVIGQAVQSVAKPAAAPRAPLSEETQRRVAQLVVKLACNAQYAKVLLLLPGSLLTCLLIQEAWKG